MASSTPNRSLPKTPERLLSLHKKYRKTKPLNLGETYVESGATNAGASTPGGTVEPSSPRLGTVSLARVPGCLKGVCVLSGCPPSRSASQGY